LIPAIALALSACIQVHPRLDDQPRRDGVLVVDASVAAPGARKVLLWIPVPRDEQIQVLRQVSAPSDAKVVIDRRGGNRALQLEIPETGHAHVEFSLTRGEEREGARLPAAELEKDWDGESWLADEGLAVADARVKAIAAEIFKDAPDADSKARAAFDYVLAHMRYAKEGTGWGTGSTAWACDAKYGNCTDFHALFLALIRSGGVPGRFRIGFVLPPAQDSQQAISGYHCWAEYWSPGRGWCPVDASEAWKHPDRRDYLFGHLDPDRLGMSLGRDLQFDGQAGPPLNYFVTPYAEADGVAVPVQTTVAWKDRPRS
jgi:transglutaminase-like putative cysteine protease